MERKMLTIHIYITMIGMDVRFDLRFENYNISIVELKKADYHSNLRMKNNIHMVFNY